MEFLLTIVYSLIFIAFISRLSFYKIDGISGNWVIAAFAVKVLAGSLLYLVYTYYYKERNNADIYKYFDDSKILYNALWNNPHDFLKIFFSFGNDTPYFDKYYGQMNNWYGIYPTNLYGDGHIMIRFNALARIISFQYLNVHTVIMNFLSFTGLIGMIRFFRMEGRKQKLLFLMIFLMPSLLFWGSGVLKEGLILFSLGIILFHFRQFAEGQNQWWRILLMLIALIILRYTKFYIFALILPLLVSGLWVSMSKRKFILLKYAFLILLAIGAGSQLYRVNPYNKISELLANKHNGFVKEAIEAKAGSLFDTAMMQPSWPEILKATLPGFLNTLLRPLPWESVNPFMLMASAENLLIIFLILFVLFRLKKPADLNLFIFSVIFFLLVYSVSGLISPISGALVRYKIPAMPFLFYAVLTLANPAHLTNPAGGLKPRQD